MKITGKLGELNLAAAGQGLSSVRLKVDGQVDPVIVSAPRAMLAPLALLEPDVAVVLTLEQPAA